MGSFKRQFEIRTGDDQPLLDDFLALWKPAGFDAGDDGLRLAIRNNYLNFYYRGQSVAKVSYGRRDDISAKVHVRYIDPNRKDQSYETIQSNNYSGKKELLTWIKNTVDHCGKEKIFVDKLVHKNPNVIDLEMALPFDPRVKLIACNEDSKNKDKKVALRMDLVALEQISSVWTIVFWEAKMVKNPEARCSGQDLPKVDCQLKNYAAWVELNKANLIKQYRKNCELLVKFHERALTLRHGIEPLGEGIIAVANGATLDLDPRPRLIIDNQIPSKSFEPHRAKLRAAGFHVQLVEKDGKYAFEPQQ